MFEYFVVFEMKTDQLWHVLDGLCRNSLQAIIVQNDVLEAGFQFLESVGPDVTDLNIALYSILYIEYHVLPCCIPN